MITNESIRLWAKNIKNKYGLTAFYVYLDTFGNIILDSIIVPKDNRKTGVGSDVMKELIELADNEHLKILLTPGVRDSHHGTTSQSRLIDFYKRFGFIKNSGNKKDYTTKHLMYRYPKKIPLKEFLQKYITEARRAPIPKELETLRPRIAQVAQRVYDDWDEEDIDTFAGGGICHLIAEEIVSLLYNEGFEKVASVSAQIGEVHVYVVVGIEDEGVFEIDIPPHVYETGGGYSWKKIKDIQISPNDVVINLLDPRYSNFNQYTDEF